VGIFRSRNIDEAFGGTSSNDYTVAVIEQQIRRIEEDAEYTQNRLKKAIEEKAKFEATLDDLVQQKMDLEAALEKLR